MYMPQMTPKEIISKSFLVNYNIQIINKKIFLGDFNGVFDPKWDRTDRVKNNERGKLPTSFFEMIDQENLFDNWKLLLSSTSKEFTFYSPRQKSYSRVDMI